MVVDLHSFICKFMVSYFFCIFWLGSAHYCFQKGWTDTQVRKHMSWRKPYVVYKMSLQQPSKPPGPKFQCCTKLYRAFFKQMQHSFKEDTMPLKHVISFKRKCPFLLKKYIIDMSNLVQQTPSFKECHIPWKEVRSFSIGSIASKKVTFFGMDIVNPQREHLFFCINKHGSYLFIFSMHYDYRKPLRADFRNICTSSSTCTRVLQYFLSNIQDSCFKQI